MSAVEMELFTELARHPESGEALRDRLGLHSRSYQDFLDALVALGFLDRSDGVYRNTPSTDMFLDKRKPSYIGGILEMANHRLYRFWGGLTEALRTGQLQNEAKSGETSFFQALYAVVGLVRDAQIRRVVRYALVAALVVLSAGVRRLDTSFDGSCLGSLGARFSAKVAALCQGVLAEKKAELSFPFAGFNPTNPDLEAACDRSL